MKSTSLFKIAIINGAKMLLLSSSNMLSMVVKIKTNSYNIRLTTTRMAISRSKTRLPMKFKTIRTKRSTMLAEMKVVVSGLK